MASTCRGHGGTVLGLAFAQGGRLLVTVSRDLTVRVWETDTGSPRARQDLPDIPFDAAFSPDGRLLAVALNNGRVYWWDSDDSFSSLIERPPLEVSSAAVCALAFTPDSETLITGGDDGIAQSWSTATGSRRGAEMKMAAPIRRLALSHDGKVLAAALPDRKGCEIWDAVGRTRIATRDNQGVRVLAFSPDDRDLVFGEEAFISLRDVRARDPHARVLYPHPGPPLGLAVHPDGRTLASVGQDGAVKWWDLGTATLRAPPRHRLGPVHALAFDPSGRRLFVGSDEPRRKLETYRFLSTREQWVRRLDDVRVWDLVAGKEEPLLPGQPAFGVPCLALTPDGSTLLAGSRGGTVWRWDLVSPRALPLRFVNPSAALRWHGLEMARQFWAFQPADSQDVRALAVSRDGRHLATLPDEGMVQVWDTAAGEVRRTLGRKHADPACLAFNPANGTLAVNDGGEVRLWDPASGQEQQVLAPGHNEPILCLAFSGSGRFLATGGWDRRIRLWDLEDRGRGPRTLPGHNEPVSCLAFAPDGRTLASGGPDATVRLWHVATAQPLGIFDGLGNVQALAFSPDGTILASGHGRGGDVRLWRTDAPRPPRR